jgi:RHS repeat-associated protein
VIEGGVVSFVRADHIGRPVFATNASGAKVWTATYTPFGGVHTSTGALPTARFPGQWFQSESGLHQNWMRDYDPTTGRYLQADPLGLVDGASVYGYVKQNPGRYVDPLGLWTVGPQGGILPDFNPYTNDLVQCDGDDCFDQWMKDQDACYSKHAAGTIADLPACLSRARDIYNHCTSGGGGPPPLPWSAYDEDVEKPGPKKPVRYGQPPAKPGITSSVGATIGAILTGILIFTVTLVFG